MSSLSSIVVDDIGTKLAYIDSGPPSSESIYTTVFAIHGMGFSSTVFDKLSAVARSRGVRFVAINRRDYRGSTPHTDADKAIFTSPDAEKTEWLRRRAFEVATFIDTFIQQEGLPPISADGSAGGIALMGWSLGNTYTCAVVAHIASFTSPIQNRFAAYLRAHILEDVPSIAIGRPNPPKAYSSLINPAIPVEKRVPDFTPWITGYFRHGDLSTRNLDVLEYITPDIFRTPSIWNMSRAEIEGMVEEGPSGEFDLPFMLAFFGQMGAVYERALFDKAVKALVPRSKTTVIVGGSAAAFSISALWAIEDDDKAHGGGNVKYNVLPEMNHFMHWDKPEETFEAVLQGL